MKKQGKYDLVEMAGTLVFPTVSTLHTHSCDVIQALLSDNGVPKKIRPSTLDSPTQSFVKLIFDKDMFKSAMAKFEIGRVASTIVSCSLVYSACVALSPDRLP